MRLNNSRYLPRASGRFKLNKKIYMAAVGIIILCAALSYERLKQEPDRNTTYSVILIKNGVECAEDIDCYITGVLAGEATISYETETIKALSVIIRTYIMQAAVEQGRNNVYAEELGLNYVDTELLKQSLGEEVYKLNIAKLENAVHSTYGEVIFFDKKIITPLYHIVSAGRTRDANAIYGEDIAYLKSVDSYRDVESEDYLQTKDIKIDEFPKDIQIISRDDSGYVLKLKADGKIYTGEEWAKQNGLYSSCFFISKIKNENNEDRIRITTKGKGHGLGLSIYGADIMAKQKYTYKDILMYYYNQTDIARIVSR